jgi:hypothetical protein
MSVCNERTRAWCLKNRNGSGQPAAQDQPDDDDEQERRVRRHGRQQRRRDDPEQVIRSPAAAGAAAAAAAAHEEVVERRRQHRRAEQAGAARQHRAQAGRRAQRRVGVARVVILAAQPLLGAHAVPDARRARGRVLSCPRIADLRVGHRVGRALIFGSERRQRREHQQRLHRQQPAPTRRDRRDAMRGRASVAAPNVAGIPADCAIMAASLVFITYARHRRRFRSPRCSNRTADAVPRRGGRPCAVACVTTGGRAARSPAAPARRARAATSRPPAARARRSGAAGPPAAAATWAGRRGDSGNAGTTGSAGNSGRAPPGTAGAAATAGGGTAGTGAAGSAGTSGSAGASGSAGTTGAGGDAGGGDNLIVNGDFSGGATNWHTEMGTGNVNNGRYCVTNPSGTTLVGYDAPAGSPLMLAGGTMYRISFQASGAGTVHLKVGMATSPYGDIYTSDDGINSNAQTYSHTFMPAASNSAGLAFTFVNAGNNMVCLDNVTLVQN